MLSAQGQLSREADMKEKTLDFFLKEAKNLLLTQDQRRQEELRQWLPWLGRWLPWLGRWLQDWGEGSRAREMAPGWGDGSVVRALAEQA